MEGGDILHPVQVARGAGLVEVEGAGKWVGTNLRHPQREEEKGWIRGSTPLQMSVSSPKLGLPSGHLYSA